MEPRVIKGESVIAGVLLAAQNEGSPRLDVGYYTKEQIESPNFPGKIVHADGLDFVVMQPKVLELLRVSALLDRKGEYIEAG